MGFKESGNSRPHSGQFTAEQNQAAESKPFFAGLKTPWEEFYRCQRERLSHIAAEMGVPPDRITDVLQEVWLDAGKHREGFQGEDAEARLSSWLGRVVRSKSRDALRRLGRLRRRVGSLDDMPAEPVDHEAKEPAEWMAEKERGESLAAALQELRKKNSLNCWLVCEHILGDRSLQDLAAQTGFGVHAISCRIGRASKKLGFRLRKFIPAADAIERPASMDRRRKK